MHKVVPLAEKAVLMLSKIPNFTPSKDDLSEEQKKDKLCRSLVNYIRHKKLPEDNNLARIILINHDQFIILDNILFRINKHISSKQIDLQIVVPQKWSTKIIESIHNTPLGGHVGFFRTYKNIQSMFYWLDMYKTIQNFVNSCQICLTTKRQPKKLKLPMNIREPIPTVYTHIMIDTIGPFVTASNNSKYIQVAICQGSRHITAWDTAHLTSAGLIKELVDKVISIYGAPKVLQTDNGSIFSSKMFKNFYKTIRN